MIHKHAPLRGAHECQRTGVVARVGTTLPEAIVVALEPSGKIGGPFYPGEYVITERSRDE